MKRLLAALAACLIATHAWAACENWSPTDIGLTAALGVAIAADAQITKHNLDSGPHGREFNPVFGTPRPSHSAIDTGAILGYGALIGVACFLPPAWRGIWLAGWMGAEFGIVIESRF